MENFKIQQRKLMGWGEPIPLHTFLERYDLSTVWDLLSRGKVQLLSSDNRPLTESETASLFNQNTSAAPAPQPVRYVESTTSYSHLDELARKLEELQTNMETIYDEMQQREADAVQKMEIMQKRFDQQLASFQKKIDMKLASLKPVAPPSSPAKRTKASDFLTELGIEDVIDEEGDDKPSK